MQIHRLALAIATLGLTGPGSAVAKDRPATTATLVSAPLATPYRENVAVRDDAIERGAAFLAASQGIFPSASNPDAVVLDGWEWVVGSGKGAGNISGVVGVGLLDAYDATGDESLLKAAAIRAETAAKLAEDGARPFAPDVEALARVGRLMGRTDWISLARKAMLERFIAAGSVEAEFARLRKGRESTPELTGYETALVADAALAAGLEEEAKELVRLAVDSLDGWMKDDASTYAIVSGGALLATCTRLGNRTAAIKLAVPLLASQLPDGSWRSRETQPTAYATRGLAMFARAFRDEQARGAAARGRGWLRLTQLKNGAWAEYNDYLPEPFVGTVYAPATAEALRAMVATR